MARKHVGLTCDSMTLWWYYLYLWSGWQVGGVPGHLKRMWFDIHSIWHGHPLSIWYSWLGLSQVSTAGTIDNKLPQNLVELETTYLSWFLIWLDLLSSFHRMCHMQFSLASAEAAVIWRLTWAGMFKLMESQDWQLILQLSWGYQLKYFHVAWEFNSTEVGLSQGVPQEWTFQEAERGSCQSS